MIAIWPCGCSSGCIALSCSTHLPLRPPQSISSSGGMKPTAYLLGSEKNFQPCLPKPITPELSLYSRTLSFACPRPRLCPNSCARVGRSMVRMSDQHAPVFAGYGKVVRL